MSQTHLVKKLSAMLFFNFNFNSGNELSPMRFFYLFFYSQGSMFMYFVIFKNRHIKKKVYTMNSFVLSLYFQTFSSESAGRV